MKTTKNHGNEKYGHYNKNLKRNLNLKNQSFGWTRLVEVRMNKLNEYY